MGIAWRVLLGYFLIVAFAGLLLGRVFLEQVKPAVRQTTEDTLADTAHTLAALAAEDMQAGRMADGGFAAALRTLGTRPIDARIWDYRKRQVAYRITVTDARGVVVFDSQGRDVGRDNSRWNDVARTLRGAYGARSTRSDPGDEATSVMWVAAPILSDGRIIGTLSVGKPNAVLQPFIAGSRDTMLRWGLALLGSALVVGVAMAWWLARQLKVLRLYAQEVTAGHNAPAPEAAAEFGELGQALEHMRRQLDGKQYVEHYIHSLTHELKSPLASLRACAELLQGTLAEPDRVRFAGHVRAQATRMTELVERLLALASLEHRGELGGTQRLDLQALLQSLCHDMEPEAAQRGVRITLHTQRGIEVEGDAFLLRQAVRNLLENALAFAPKRSLIRCRACTEHHTVRIGIEDQGPGVPEFALPRVFERFYTLPREGGTRGTGLGLPFVAAVAALHGGHATLVNTGHGALATLVLPRAR